MADVKKYTLKFKEELIEIEDKDGNVKRYIMREFDGQVRDQYQEEIGRRMEIGPDGKGVKIKNYQGWESTLLKLVLFEITNTDPFTTVAVEEKVIQSWPSSVREALHKDAQELCGLSKKADDDAKND